MNWSPYYGKMNILKRLFPSKNVLPDYKNLKKTLKGKNGFLFLINDSNNELKQHFDFSYKKNFNASLFIKILEFKSKFCKKKNIEYYFFIIPDKSIVCKEKLPFEVKKVKRNYNAIRQFVPDFANKLDPNCYFKKDSHINYFGGKRLVYFYLNYIDSSFTMRNFKKLLQDQILKLDRLRICDLTMPKNWSYPEEEIKKYPNDEIKYFKNKYLINLKENIPEKFKQVNTRETEYYKNPKGFKNLRVLIFRDSSLEMLRDVLSIYFQELLLYWDHWNFNEKLIEWYKPDIILEIRTERFLENNYFLKDILNMKTLDEIFESLMYEDSDIRNIMAVTLGNIGDVRAVEPLTLTLNDENSHVSNNATISLEKIGKPAVKYLIHALNNNNNKSVRSLSAKTLGNIGDERGIEPLIQALNDDQASVRNNAVTALGNIGDIKAVEPLTLTLNDKNSHVRNNAKKALEKIGKRYL